MQEDFGDGTRTEAAQTAIARLVTGLPDYVPSGLMSFGSRMDAPPAGEVEACSSAEIMAFPSRMTVDTVEADVQALSNTGRRPLAGMALIAGPTIDSARGDTDPDGEGSPGRLLVIASGADTCGAGVSETVEALGPEPPVVDVIGLAVPSGDDDFLRTLATATGGSYTDVRTPGSLSEAIDAVAARPTEAVRDALCQVEASRAAQTCRGTFADDVQELLLRRSGDWRDAGRVADAERLEVFTEVVNRSLDGDEASVAVVDTRIEEFYTHVTTARERFEEQYGTSLPGPDLASAANCAIVTSFA